MNLPSVSVIIPAYNARSTIHEVLQALMAQDYDHSLLEVIVVDDGSTDDTATIVKSFTRVLLFSQTNAGPASARNRGAQESSGEILFFTDSDCVPEADWIRKMVLALKGAPHNVVAGSYGIANPRNWLARVIHQEIRYRHVHIMPECPSVFGSYNFAIFRKVFHEIGGFNVGYRRASGEDNDLSYKIISSGRKIYFLKDACVRHYHQTSVSKYLHEQYRHGFWRAMLYRDHPWMARGDGYTFWKDMAEVPFVLLHVFLLIFPCPGFLIVLYFFLFEISWGFIICGIKDGIPAGIVWWMRSFARTAGLLSGIGSLLVSIKK